MRGLRDPTSKGTAFSVEPQKECQATETSTFLAEVSKDQAEVEPPTFHRIEPTNEGPNMEQDISSPEIANIRKSNRTMKADPGKIQATSEECRMTDMEKMSPHTTPDKDAEDIEICPLEGIDAKVTSVGRWTDDQNPQNPQKERVPKMLTVANWLNSRPEFGPNSMMNETITSNSNEEKLSLDTSPSTSVEYSHVLRSTVSQIIAAVGERDDLYASKIEPVAKRLNNKPDYDYDTLLNEGITTNSTQKQVPLNSESSTVEESSNIFSTKEKLGRLTTGDEGNCDIKQHKKLEPKILSVSNWLKSKSGSEVDYVLQETAATDSVQIKEPLSSEGSPNCMPSVVKPVQAYINDMSYAPNLRPEISSPKKAHGLKSNKTAKTDLGKIQATPEEECRIAKQYNCIDKFRPDTTPDSEIWALESNQSIDAKITSVGSWLKQLKGKT